jgi:lipoprotein signal peptidase
VQERGAVAALIRGDGSRLRAIAYGLAVLVLVADRVTTSIVEGHLHDVTHLWGPFGLALSFNSGFAFRLISGHHGQVADFLTLTHWPTFNLADACVTVGVVVLAIALVVGAPRPTAS